MNPRSKTTQLSLKSISIIIVAMIGIFAYVSLFTSSESIVNKLTVEWPQPKATLTETQTFRVAVASDYEPENVRVVWSVEDDRQTGELSFDGSVFVADVNTAMWDWKRDNQYTIHFTALNNEDDILATSSVVVLVGQAMPTITEQSDSSATTSTVRTEADFMDTFVVPNTQMGAIVTAPAVPNLTPAQKFRVEWVPGPERGNQQFIFHTEGYTGRDISAFWSAEGGHKNLVFKDANAKIFTAALNVGGWLWKGVGPYPITFSITDKNTSAEIASEVLELYWKGKPGESGIEFRSRGVSIKVPATTPPVVVAATPSTSTIKTPPVTPPSVIPTVKPNSTPPATTVVTAPQTKVLAATTILGKTNLYIPTKPAVVNTLAKLTDATQKNAHTYILNQPSAVWLNGDSYETDAYIKGIIASAVAKNTVPSFVLYNIVQRDCNSYSSGGAKTMADYKAWINRLSNVFKNSAAIIVVEPDALSMLNCVSGTQKTERLEMISYAVTALTQTSPKLLVYIDAGHPFWVNAEEMATRLKSAGVGSARGFAINVSSYASTQDNVTFGTYLSNLLGGKQYVIDTSRNGNGRASNGEWCNPSGRALGQSGTIYPGNKGALDALLWIKFPGESDGTCNGGPGAGAWWPEYATGLFTNRK